VRELAPDCESRRDTGSPTSTGSFDAFGFRVHFDFK
jgi:hypothetical protein